MLDMAGFSFDQFQRYSIMRDLIIGMKRTLGKKHVKVLDVGGFFRLASGEVRFPIHVVLPDDDPTVVDVATCLQPNYIRASGASLPFADASFDVVLSCDALEHVIPSDRPNFVAELGRVTKRYLILVAPVDSQKTRLSERIANEFVRLRSGSPQPQLQEHIRNGLPRASDVEAALKKACFALHSFPYSDIYGWLFMMMAKHYLLPIRGSDDLHELVDRFYIENFVSGALPESAAEQCYGRFFVASKSPGDPFLANLIEKQKDLIDTENANRRQNSQETGVASLSLSQILVSLATREFAADGDEKIDIAIDNGWTPVGEIVDGRVVGQTFVSHKANLCRIDLLMATFCRTNSGTVEMRVYENSTDGPLIASIQMEAAAIPNNRWVAFRFPPQLLSRNKVYYFALTHEGGVAGNATTAYSHPYLSLCEMSRYENGNPVNGQLMFRTYFLPPTPEEERLAEHHANTYPPSDIYGSLITLGERYEADMRRVMESLVGEKRGIVERYEASIDRLRNQYEHQLTDLREEQARKMQEILLALRS